MVSYIGNENTISIIFEGNMLKIKKDHKYFGAIIEGIEAQEWDLVSRLLENCRNCIDMMFDDDDEI